MMVIKRAVERIPVVGPTGRSMALAMLARTGKIQDSREYWEKRYRAGGNSGSGSYNRLAEFKASVLNDFVRSEQVATVLEFGCGDGAQLELATYPDYVGFDVAPTAVTLCRNRFAQDPTKRFYGAEELPEDLAADMTLSLDVIYHLVEDEVFDRYMTDLFDRARRYVVIYSSDRDDAVPARHVRHRAFSRWIEQCRPGWSLLTRVPNPYGYDPRDPHNTSFADFHVYRAPRH